MDKVAGEVEMVKAKLFLPTVLRLIWNCQAKMALSALMAGMVKMPIVADSREMLTMTFMLLMGVGGGMAVMAVMEVTAVQ
jgi:hypothetical protein